MPAKERNHDLVTMIAELREEDSLDLVRRLMADGVEPLAIIDLCHKGMERVGELYEKGEYFIAGLFMAGEIMDQVGQLVLPLIKNKITNDSAGRIVLGTVEGDIHHIGKEIFKFLVRGYGFTVHDLGVDVPPSKFIAAIHEFRPDIVGLSCLISAAYKNMEESIALLKKNLPPGLASPVYLIGGRVDRIVCKDVGADYWANDAMEGVRVCQKIIGRS